MSKVVISGFDKLSLLNYPGHIACTIFTSGCNFKCPFCHNSSLINNDSEHLEENDIIQYLDKRKNILEGVCITGGEPLIHKGIVEFISKIKKMGYKVKLDTNGSNPVLLQKLIDKNLIDYVAMDIKNTFGKYELTNGVKTNIDNIKKSIDILKNNVEHEFRTTIVKEFHTLKDLASICKLVEGSNYYLQNFEMSDGVLNKSLHGFSEAEINEIERKLKEKYSNIYIR